MICWSCQRNAGDEVFCPACGAVEPPDPKADSFRVLGVPRAFEVDLSALEARYKELTKLLHPDRFTRADPRARRASLDRSVQLNQAWRCLGDPVRRAEYLLSLHGIQVGEDSGRTSGERSTVPVPQATLMEMMDLREALAEAHAAKDDAKMQALVGTVRTRLDRTMDEVARGFACTPPELSANATRLVVVRYYTRFLDESRAFRDADESEPGAVHAG